MDPELLINLLGDPYLALAFAALALLATAFVGLRLSSQNRQIRSELNNLRERLDRLWHDVDEWHTNPAGNSHEKAPPVLMPDTDRFLLEKEAYEKVWPQMWALHDKLGNFLRAVETGEPAGESRLIARNAALDARDALSRVRPFCHSDVEDLATRIIDCEVKAHFTACQYLDLFKDTSATNHDQERSALQDKFRKYYDGEARDLLTQLVNTIRHRTLR